ncbi:hypothetical protein CHS0354_029505 [Potamilus streckersoni]|uniref:RNA polymerase-associated protein LEO1 n=1 Tax=Potamilus streckersoni TaxID=2493646 RepID=A0AAE0S7L8_9BIVA|nr:hypothetical protein CHS0354_029505 [Potamilus streckersoni]
MAAIEEMFGSDAESDGSLASISSRKSGSASPASGHSSPASGKRSGSASPASGRSSPTSGKRSRSGSPASRSSRKSGSASPASGHSSPASGKRSRSGSPASRSSRKSGSASPASGHSSPASGKRSGSASPASGRSSPTSGKRSRSGSPASRSSRKSGSASPASGHSSPASGKRSGSASPASGHSSPASGKRSRSGSPASRSSRKSGSASPASGHSSPASGKRSGSASPASGHSSPASGKRSRSGSPAGGGSDSEDSVIGRKKKRKVASDGEGTDDNKIDTTVGELFGDADDISSDEEGREKGDAEDVEKGGEEGDETKRAPVIEDGDEEGEQEPEEPPETRIEVEIPRIITNLGKALHYVKLPNFLSVETRPFDRDTYEDEIDEDEVLDEEGRARCKLKVENTMRWRTVKDEEGNELKDEFDKPVRESNAKIVRWSDGSMSLHLGDEIFDVHAMPIQGDFNHLFVRQGTGLQGQSVFKTKLTFRPHSTESFTHRKMTLSLADRSTKTQKVKVLPISGRDPDAHRTEMIKKEEERLRASIRRESHQRRVREKTHARGVSAGYLEGGYDDEEDDEEVSIAAIKKQFKPGTRKEIPNIYSSDSEDAYDSDKEEKGAKRLLKAKKLDSDEEDEGSDSGPKKKKPKVVESDEEEEAGGAESAASDEEGGRGGASDHDGGGASGTGGGSDSD